MDTTWIYPWIYVRAILIVHRPVTPKYAGESGSNVNDDGVVTLKQDYSR